MSLATWFAATWFAAPWFALGFGGCSPSCEEIDARAESAVAEAAACSRDSDCRALAVPDSCVPAISCYAAVAASADDTPVVAAIRGASSDRRASGCGCALVRCAPTPPSVRCSEGMCAIVAP